MKFGGTSVEDGPAFDRAANIVRDQKHLAPVVVVSALAGMTDALMKSVRLAAGGEEHRAAIFLEEPFERHLQIARNLGSASRNRMQLLIDETRREIQKQLQIVAVSRKSLGEIQDSVISNGERLSANLMAMELEEYGLPAAYVDARSCILTNATPGNAQPLPGATARRTQARLKPLIAAKIIPVLGGFMGATVSGVTTTLGRGSSDYSATLIGAALNTREIQIWTDVNGVHTADPSLVSAARTVSQLSYCEAAELARLGARVLHPKMIQPVLAKGIPIRICNSRAPEQVGTIIRATGKASRHAVKAIAHQANFTCIDIASTPSGIANGFLHAVEKVFKRHRHEMKIMAMSESRTSFACEETETLASIVRELRRIGAVRLKSRRAIISCVGERLLSARGSAQKVLNIASNIDPAMSWRSTSSLNLMSMVSSESAGEILGRLHEEIFERDSPRESAGS